MYICGKRETERDFVAGSIDATTAPLEALLVASGALQESMMEDLHNQIWHLRREVADLKTQNWKLQQEKAWWQEWWNDVGWQREQEIETMRSGHFFSALQISSPLTMFSEYASKPDHYGNNFKFYESSCPCCRRPLNLTISESSETRQPCHELVSSGRFAFAACLWGANAGYAFGALVLGARLREVSPTIKRVLLHTDDVPSNYLEAFAHDGLWDLHSVNYIDGVEDLYVSKGSVFDGVFTKLSVWKLCEYDKVLLLDLDIMPCKSLDELFELRCPAALIRGQSDKSHGQKIDGKHFFPGRKLSRLSLGARWWYQCWRHSAAARHGDIQADAGGSDLQKSPLPCCRLWS